MRVTKRLGIVAVDGAFSSSPIISSSYGDSCRADGSSEVLVLIERELHSGGILEFLVHVLNLVGIDGNFRGLKDGGLNEGEVGVTKTNILVRIRCLISIKFAGRKMAGFQVKPPSSLDIFDTYPTRRRRSQMKGFSNW